MADTFTSICDRNKAIYEAKAAEYDSQDNPFENFDGAAALMRQTINPAIPEKYHPLVAALWFEAKQIVGFVNLIAGNKDNEAAILDKVKDKQVYAVIQELLYLRSKETMNLTMSEATESESWIGVDLDGTLAHYDTWRGIEHIGEPLMEMVDRVKGWISRGKTVKIFTARVCKGRDGYTIDDIKILIQNWCEQHIGYRLDVTNAKDFNMIELWDDRCVAMITNTGTTV